MAISMKEIISRMNKIRQAKQPANGRGRNHSDTSYTDTAMPAGTPGANNPSSSVRTRTTKSGKGVVPAKAKTPRKNQLTKKARKSVHSTPVGYKKKKIKNLKGGTGTPKAAKMRGGYGATRANLGFAAATAPIQPVIGK